MKPIPITLVRYVLPARMEELTGYTVKAMERKIESGVWLEGYEYVYAPDGKILISIEGYNRWVEGQRRAG